jgi:hypothetical protein
VSPAAEPNAGHGEAAGGTFRNLMFPASGPASVAFERLMARLAAGLRVGGAVAGGVGAVLGLAVPAAPTAVGVAVAALLGWAAGYGTSIIRRGWARWLVAGDVAVVAALCLGYRWLVPAATLPGWSTWLAVVASSAVVAAQVSPWPVLGALGAVFVPAAYVAGSMLAGRVAPEVPVLLASQGIGAGVVMVVLRRHARAADRAVVEHEALLRDAAVRQGRRAEEREHCRLLHDSVSATLTVVAAGGAVASPTVRAQAMRDLAVVERLRAPLGARPIGAAPGDTDLAGCLAPVVAARPELVIEAAVEPAAVPAAVGAAFADAVGEVLRNVVRHAGTRAVALRGGCAGGVVWVELVDGGRGFDAAGVAAQRRGLRESVIGRMSRIGGTAEVSSRPGAGTRVVLRWAAGADHAPGAGGASGAGGGRAAGGGFGDVVASRYQRGLELVVVFVLVARHLVSALVAVLSYRSAYRSFGVELLAWAVLAAAGAIGSVRLLRHRTGRATPWLLAGAALAGSALAAVAMAPGHALTGAHWAMAATGWTGVLVLLRRPIAELAAFLTANAGVTLAELIRDGAADRVGVARFAMAIYVLTAIQVGVALVVRAVDGTARQATVAAERQAAVRRRVQVAEALHRSRLRRYETVRDSVVPLLIGLSTGDLDPADPGTQRRCAVEGSRLRRLFAETDDVPDPLLHELRACADVAHRRGVLVDLHVVGRLPVLSVPVRRALTDAPLHALAAARRQARVTVFGHSDEVAISVLADAEAGADTLGPAPAATPTGCGVTVTVTVTVQEQPHQRWTESRWQA